MGESSGNHNLFHSRAKQGSPASLRSPSRLSAAHSVTVGLAALWRHQGRKQFDMMLSWDQEILQGPN